MSQIVDERTTVKTFGEMAPGQHFLGTDGKVYRKLSNDADRNCWNEESDTYQPADPASTAKYQTVNSEIHLVD